MEKNSHKDNEDKNNTQKGQEETANRMSTLPPWTPAVIIVIIVRRTAASAGMVSIGIVIVISVRSGFLALLRLESEIIIITDIIGIIGRIVLVFIIIGSIVVIVAAIAAETRSLVAVAAIAAESPGILSAFIAVTEAVLAPDIIEAARIAHALIIVQIVLCSGLSGTALKRIRGRIGECRIIFRNMDFPRRPTEIFIVSVVHKIKTFRCCRQKHCLFPQNVCSRDCRICFLMIPGRGIVRLFLSVRIFRCIAAPLLCQIRKLDIALNLLGKLHVIGHGISNLEAAAIVRADGQAFRVHRVFSILLLHGADLIKSSDFRFSERSLVADGIALDENPFTEGLSLHQEKNQSGDKGTDKLHCDGNYLSLRITLQCQPSDKTLYDKAQ